MYCLNQLKGHIHIILGNHDSDARRLLFESVDSVEDIAYADMIKAGKWKFFLSHYPTMVGNFDDPKKRWNISGHTHSTDKFQLKEHLIYNVAVDAHDGFPVALDEIKADIRGLMYGD
jgi:calcineurin-like phosphoesterase family protein